MEYLVDLSFTKQDRMELLRRICEPGSSFCMHLNPHLPLVISTFPGPYLPPLYISSDALYYFSRIGDYYPYDPGLKNRFLTLLYSLYTPLFISDISLWFHNTVLSEIKGLPQFVSEDNDAYDLCLRHFPVPYPKPSMYDPASTARENIYDILYESQEYSVYGSDNKEESFDNVSSESKSASELAKVKYNEDGSQSVSVDEETKKTLDSLHESIQKGQF